MIAGLDPPGVHLMTESLFHGIVGWQNPLVEWAHVAETHRQTTQAQWSGAHNVSTNKL